MPRRNPTCATQPSALPSAFVTHCLFAFTSPSPFSTIWTIKFNDIVKFFHDYRAGPPNSYPSMCAVIQVCAHEIDVYFTAIHFKHPFLVPIPACTIIQQWLCFTRKYITAPCKFSIISFNWCKKMSFSIVPILHISQHHSTFFNAVQLHTLIEFSIVFSSWHKKMSSSIVSILCLSLRHSTSFNAIQLIKFSIVFSNWCKKMSFSIVPILCLSLHRSTSSDAIQLIKFSMVFSNWPRRCLPLLPQSFATTQPLLKLFDLMFNSNWHKKMAPSITPILRHSSASSSNIIQHHSTLPIMFSIIFSNWHKKMSSCVTPSFELSFFQCHSTLCWSSSASCSPIDARSYGLSLRLTDVRVFHFPYYTLLTSRSVLSSCPTLQAACPMKTMIMLQSILRRFKSVSVCLSFTCSLPQLPVANASPNCHVPLLHTLSPGLWNSSNLWSTTWRFLNPNLSPSLHPFHFLHPTMAPSSLHRHCCHLGCSQSWTHPMSPHPLPSVTQVAHSESLRPRVGLWAC